MTDWDRDVGLTPGRNAVLLSELRGKRIHRVARLMSEDPEAAWRESRYQQRDRPRSDVFATYDMQTLLVAEDRELFVAQSDYMSSLTVERTSDGEVRNVLERAQLLDATDPVFADGRCAAALGRRIDAVETYRRLPERYRGFDVKDLAPQLAREPHETLLVFGLEGGMTLAFSRTRFCVPPYPVSIDPVIDPAEYTRVARVG